MSQIERRQFLKTTVAGTVVGAETASASDLGANSANVVRQLTATAEDGFMTIDADNPQGDGSDIGRVDFAGHDLGGAVEISGEIYDDETWQSTNVSFPDIDIEEFITDDDLSDLPIDLSTDDINDDIQVNVDTITGQLDAEEGFMTADLSLTVDAYAEIDLGLVGSATLDFDIEVNALLTTGQSGELEGSASGLTTKSGTATLVNNDYTVPATGESVEVAGFEFDIDDQLGLPANDPSRNYLELQLDIQFSGFARTNTLTGTVTNQSGSPLSGITVQVNDDSGTTLTTATTDSSGEYSAGVPSGTYDLAVSDPDYDSASETVSVSDEETATVDFQVAAKSSVIEGTVRDFSGPLENEEVTLVDGDQTVDTAITSGGETDRGTYALTAQPGEYDIIVEKDGYEPFEQTVTVEPNSTLTVQIRLNSLPTLVVGQIADPDGDGLYEDVRGDGRVDILDVQALFTNLGRDLLSFHSEKFNFSGENPDEVTILDVQALFNKLPE